MSAQSVYRFPTLETCRRIDRRLTVKGNPMRRPSDIRSAKKAFPAFLHAIEVGEPVIPSITEFCETHAVDPDVLIKLIPENVVLAISEEALQYEAPRQRVRGRSHKKRDLETIEMRQYIRNGRPCRNPRVIGF